MPNASHAARPAAGVATLAWLTGCWVEDLGPVRVEDEWAAPAGHRMLGVSRTRDGDSTVAPQALFLLNNNFTLDQIKGLTERMNCLASAKIEARVDWLYENLFGRPASSREKKLALKFIDNTPESWEAYVQALLASNEFVYID